MRTSSGKRIAAGDDRRPDKQLALVNEPGPDRLHRQVRTVDAEGEVGAGLQVGAFAARQRACADSINLNAIAAGRGAASRTQ
jgi:hypothetical protein